MGHSHLQVPLTERTGVESPQCPPCVPLKVAALMGCQRRRELALGASPRPIPAAEEKISGHGGGGGGQDTKAGESETEKKTGPRKGRMRERGWRARVTVAELGPSTSDRGCQLAAGVWMDRGDLRISTVCSSFSPPPSHYSLTFH